MSKIHLINLGCVRNLVDAQGILGRLAQKGFEVVDLKDADTLMINTCGFIKDAKQESIDAILEAVDFKKQGAIKRLIVTGCLSQRYADDLKKEFPEVDAFVGVQELLKDAVLAQVPLTPDYMAYLKICESCFNHCAFCVIPQIKGAFASRTRESLRQEIALIDERGVKELNIIGQDTTAYGMDLYGKKVLADMLREVSRQVQGIHWIRLLYTFPAHVTDELLDVVAQEPKLCKYIDVPFQHISDSLLSRMNRNFSSDQSRALVENIRKRVPGVRIRSAFIVGLPGEGEREFGELLDFLRWARFDRAGVFSYSPEEGTPAARMGGQVSQTVKKQRYDQAMALQQEISAQLNERLIGNELEVLIEGFDADQKRYFGRSEFDAPEVDGLVYVRTTRGRVLTPGTFERVRITGAFEYDLVGEVQ